MPAGQEGTYAEKLAVKAAVVAKKPDSLSHVNAAALALIGLTAQNSVEDTLKLKRGETILVQGGAGGVASYAIQLAKHIGAQRHHHHQRRQRGLCALARRRSGDRLHQGGFHQDRPGVRRGVRDGRRRRRDEILRRAQAGRPRRLHRLRQKAPPTSRTDVQGLRPPVPRTRAAMERVAELFAAGAIKAPEIKLYKLEQAAEAHRVSEGRHFRGKMVFQVR